jgi:hypothetical protein
MKHSEEDSLAMSDPNDPRPNLATVYCQRIRSWETLIARTSENPALKYKAADYFNCLMLTRVFAAGVTRFFFESGSSIAIQAQTFRKFVEACRGLPPLAIETNNILACLEFELFGRFPVTLYPPGPPEDKYGATFGPLGELPPLPPPTPTIRHRGVPEELMAPMRERFARTFGENGIIFMSASGLEMSAASGFQGPHVGSYPNMLFKRVLLETGCPTVMFMDQSKIRDGAFIEGTCHPVCDDKLTWTGVCQSRPFALAIGADDRDALQPLLVELGKMGLTSQRVERKGSDFGVVVANQMFDERFPEDCSGLLSGRFAPKPGA